MMYPEKYIYTQVSSKLLSLKYILQTIMAVSLNCLILGQASEDIFNVVVGD